MVKQILEVTSMPCADYCPKYVLSYIEKGVHAGVLLSKLVAYDFYTGRALVAPIEQYHDLVLEKSCNNKFWELYNPLNLFYQRKIGTHVLMPATACGYKAILDNNNAYFKHQSWLINEKELNRLRTALGTKEGKIGIDLIRDGKTQTRINPKRRQYGFLANNCRVYALRVLAAAGLRTVPRIADNNLIPYTPWYQAVKRINRPKDGWLAKPLMLDISKRKAAPKGLR